MPSLDNTVQANQIATTIDIMYTLESTLKLFEDDRKKSFVNWQFSDDEQCSVGEVTN